jgi:hypothetical protein
LNNAVAPRTPRQILAEIFGEQGNILSAPVMEGIEVPRVGDPRVSAKPMSREYKKKKQHFFFYPVLPDFLKIIAFLEGSQVSLLCPSGKRNVYINV